MGKMTINAPEISDKYVIITPAYNEAGYIAKTIESVVSQTVLPSLWVIVDDGSTDSTANVIQQYEKRYSWIKYVYRKKESDHSYFASNVYAIIAGYEHVKAADYDFLAILDADITLPRDYYQQIFKRFNRDQKLGIASGVYQDLVNGKLRKILNDRRSTPKALMVFRKQCYQDIGGFIPMKYGGEDTVACAVARMKDWKTWSFPELCVVHNKPIGHGHSKRMLKIRFRNGVCEYFVGTHPLFFLVKSIRRCFRERPYLFGGLSRIVGYCYGCFGHEKKQITNELARYIKREQLSRLFYFNRIPKDVAFNDTEKKLTEDIVK